MFNFLKNRLIMAILAISFIIWGVSEWAPLNIKNLFYSTFYSNFYDPVLVEDLPIWQKGYSTQLSFTPKYFGKYSFLANLHGEKLPLTYNKKTLNGSLRVKIITDNDIIFKNVEKWDGAYIVNSNRRSFVLFSFHVAEDTNNVQISITVEEPFSYFKNIDSYYSSIQSTYTK